MKKISFTNLSYSNFGSLYGRAAFLLLFAWCFSMNTAFAQDVPVINMPSDSSARVVDRITECNGGNAYEFRDDDTGDGALYSDFDTKNGSKFKGNRADTTVFCPTDQWSRVKVTFTEFDLAPLDTLFAFQGDLEALETALLIRANDGLAAAAAAAGKTLPTGAKIPKGTTIADLEGLCASLKAAKTAADSVKVLKSAIKLGYLVSTTTVDIAHVRTDLVDFLHIAKKAVLIAQELGAGGLAGTSTGAGVGATTLAQSRSSVSDAFGGWVNAVCDPGVNASGCLTFIFQTNGDRNKGTGWSAWVSCEERDITLSGVTIPDVRLQCTDRFGNPLRSARIRIPAPTVEGCDTATVADSVFLRIHNQYGDICLNRMLSESGAGFPTSITSNFAIGQYMAVYKLKSDTTKTLSVPFSVQAPALVANDEIRVPFGAACMSILTPDDVLEQPCDTGRLGVRAYMQYNITVTIGEGKNKVTLVTTGHDKLDGPVQYPVITGDTIKAAGVSICDGTATVKIERIYYGDRDDDGAPDFPFMMCNNGAKSLVAESIIRFSDETKPWIDIASAPDTLIACDTTGLAAMLEANAIDNCDDDIKVDFTVSLSKTDPCFADDGTIGADTTIAIVTFIAEDDCGNKGTATKEIVMVRPDIDSLEFIAKSENVSVECGETATYFAPGLRIGVWKDGKLEATDTVRLNTETYVCGYILVSTVENIPSTDCGEKKYVYWDALDWCDPNGGPRRVDTTFIEYTDETAPTFDTLQGEDLTIELDHFSCTYDINKITQPKASDNCGNPPTVTLVEIRRIEDGATDWVIDPSDWTKLDCDSFQLMWFAADDCHEQTEVDTLLQTVVIEDVTLPSAACQDQLNISLPNEWGARVCAEDIDAGSYDACGIESILIRIKGSGDDYAECINIGCEYVHPDLQIEMQVTDKKGNTNTCWLDVVVEDKINPICTELDDVEEDCDEYHNGELGEATDDYVTLEGDLMDLYNAKFGNPVTLKQCEDNLKATECGQLTYEQQYKLSVWPCGEQIAHRRYRATDWSGNKSGWAEQKITITYKADWKITLPADWTGACGESAPAEDIVLSNGACDLLGYEVTEKQFDIPGDACFKIERTYHIINWCKFVAGQDPVEIARVEGEHSVVEATQMITSEGNEDGGYWTYIQVLKVHDEVAPVVTVIDPTPCINGVDFDAEPYGEEDITPGSGPFECDETKVWSATATDCSSKITWIGILYNKATGAKVAEVETNEISYVVSNKETYYAEFWAFDNCGNSGGKKGEDIKFWDCKKPTPYVLNGIAVDLGETGTIQVWATDLNQNSFDNCTDQFKLDFRIWADFLDGDAPTDAAGVAALDKVLTFDCDRVGTNVVYIYVMDEENNWDFAQTYAIVQDNMDVCDNDPQGGGMVAGKIVNANGENVEAVNVTVTGGADESLITGTDGQFQFALATGADYTVTPVKDINPLNGVSTFDLVLISKHILGIAAFDSPYKQIAADVNKSGSITAFDMVQLRQLILNITTEFSNNDSWRFVDADHKFTSANAASENFNEFYNITALNGTMENMDFVGVKIGDVNGSARANSLLGAESRTTNDALTLTTADRFVEAGQTVTVAFTAAEIANTLGYQFTLNVAGQNAEIVEGVAKAANFNTNLAERGVITTSWNGQATATEELFAVTFNATTSGLVSEMVRVNSDITTAEAYNAAGELMDVNINFTTTAAAGFTLAQNTPNPFTDVTTIGFNLPEAGTATLTVMDVQGKVLKSIRADYAKGANQVSLNANELGATGVLYYQLESADNVATKKMIILE